MVVIHNEVYRQVKHGTVSFLASVNVNSYAILTRNTTFPIELHYTFLCVN